MSDVPIRDAEDMSEQPLCELCGEPMPSGEEMFKFHGYSGPCPTLPRRMERERDVLAQQYDACNRACADLAELRVEAVKERDEYREKWARTIDEIGRVIRTLACTNDDVVAVQACQPHASDLARRVVAERDEALALLRDLRPLLCDVLKITSDAGSPTEYDAVAALVDRLDALLGDAQ